MERVMGIEPTSSAWEAEVLPLNYTRRTRGASPAPTRILFRSRARSTTVASLVGPLELAAGRLAVEVNEAMVSHGRCVRASSPFAVMFA